MHEPTAQSAASGTVPPLRIAIVGAGPRALSALDSLGRRLRAASDLPRRVLIDVIDPGAHPGTGAACDPEQPPYLRLNVTAAIVDAHEPDAADRVTPAFRDWAAEHGITAGLQDYPPRETVGAYLTQAWQDVVGALPEGVELELLRARAIGLRGSAQRGEAWELELAETLGTEPLGTEAQPSSGSRWSGPYDEVLLATGHAADHPGALRHAGHGPVPLVEAVYPVSRQLGPETVPAGARVAVRGAALTFIDAALALTEGRGGRFREEADGRLEYLPSGQEPAVILPSSRSGLLLDAKPDPVTEADPRREQIVAAGQAEIRASEDVSEILAAVQRTAQRLLRREEDLQELFTVSAPQALAEQVGETLRTGAEPGPRQGRALRALRRSIDAAHDTALGGPAWALGRAWSLLYPALVERMSLQELPAQQWEAFRTAAAACERWAFGPPLIQARRLESLIRAGIVDLSRLDAGIPIDDPETSVDVLIDAALAPPGIPAEDPLLSGLVRDGLLSVPWGRRGCRTSDSAQALDAQGDGVPGLSVIGRPVEDVILGHDTLNRRLHPQPERWAQRVLDAMPWSPMTATPPVDAPVRAAAHGVPALPARLEPWMQELLADPQACTRLLDQHGSPVNLLDPQPLEANAQELIDAAAARGVDLRVFVARKANKMLAVVDRARELGHGIDVGSERELRQVLDRGMAPQDIVLTAAIKPEPLLRLAVEHGVTVAVDNLDELSLLRHVASQRPGAAQAAPIPLALRLAPEPVEGIAPTRFGESARTWEQELAGSEGRAEEHRSWLRVTGVHFHLHGYDPAHRSEGLRQALALVDALRARGHESAWIDLGGGIPMSYLEDPRPWAEFWHAHENAVLGRAEPLTWRGDGLGLRREDTPDGPRLAGVRDLYPYHQQLTRGVWLGEVLDAPLPREEHDDDGHDPSLAEALRERGLELRCEPGRSMLDGCGMTLARVVFRKHTSDGVPIVGLEMNRTQCRSTSADFLVDPLLVPAGPSRSHGQPDPANPWEGPIEAFLVGAYCVEAELILKRRIAFPQGVAVGDVIALPNTGGYLMHIMESASHQIPLAANAVRTPDGWRRDDIDGL